MQELNISWLALQSLQRKAYGDQHHNRDRLAVYLSGFILPLTHRVHSRLVEKRDRFQHDNVGHVAIHPDRRLKEDGTLHAPSLRSTWVRRRHVFDLLWRAGELGGADRGDRARPLAPRFTKRSYVRALSS